MVAVTTYLPSACRCKYSLQEGPFSSTISEIRAHGNLLIYLFLILQFQYLADKYAPAAPEISETLVKLQIPPELHNQSLANTNFVPLPKRHDSSNSKHHIALIIREGRRVASSLTDFSKSSQSSCRESRPPTTMTSLSTILEQDFTVEGKKKGSLECPFSQVKMEEPQAGSDNEGREHDAVAHDASDPICAAMNDELGSQPTTSGAAAKCPIRYMDNHSPEEIAHYLETHKHELPRSHEVCVRRYQKSEDQIKKLDAKYGNLANMVEGLSRIHQPMLPEQDTRPQSDVEKVSNRMVENWAQTVSATVTDDPDRTTTALEPSDEAEDHHLEEERQSHFDRPLKEVRVGESPSRPWGISVPIYDPPSGLDGDFSGERPESPPPAPVPMPTTTTTTTTTSLPSPSHPATPPTTKGGERKCPFDHAKMRQMMDMDHTTPIKREEDQHSSVRLDNIPAAQHQHHQPFTTTPLPGGGGHAGHPPPPQGGGGRHASPPPQPAFLNAADVARPKPGTPQMLFTGPVFIGYPVEQAIQIIQHFQGQQ